MSKQAAVVAATIIVSAVLFSSLVVMQANGHDVAFGPAAGPTKHSADHAKAQATARDDEPAPTF